jgi:hypothetical protein
MPISAQTRNRKGRGSRVDPDSDRLLNMAQVAHRWGCTAPVARQRLERNGVRIIRFSRCSTDVWLSDVVALENKFTTQN